MKTSQLSLFDEEKRYAKLTELGDPLEKVDSTMDWEMFREKLTKICQKEDYAKGGRPPIDVITKFKASVLRRIYNLSFDQIEYQINNRLGFMRFLGIGLNEQVLDSRTIWDFENKLVKTGLIDEMFFMFDEKLEKEGLITHKETIIDATFVDVPKQRNNHEENKIIKNGEITEEWENPENAPKLAQKDVDTCWEKKNNETHFGYKDYVKCDSDSKLITHYAVTNVTVHDNRRSTMLLDDTNENFYADSAYSSAEMPKI